MNQTGEGILILGSTGSIGRSTLEVIRANPGRYQVEALSCGANVELLAQQIQEFQPRLVSVAEGKREQLKSLLPDGGKSLTILEGQEGNCEVASLKQGQKLVAAMVGAAGMKPVMEGILAKKTIALANKESIVLAGRLMTEAAQERGVAILPVDSEHNAIFQSLGANRKEDLAFITLTASGGPFWNRPLADFAQITVAEALKHPNWSMGAKITIDSASMMNKALEVIEARWLFDLKPEQIKVLIHPQSIVHSLVTFKDGSSLCQLGVPDMKIPIANCLAHPQRINSGAAFLNLAQSPPLVFLEPDHQKFPALDLAYQALRLAGGAPAALNGGNEVLVELFLEGQIGFLRISQELQKLLHLIQEKHRLDQFDDCPFLRRLHQIEDAHRADQWGRQQMRAQLQLPEPCSPSSAS